MFPMHVLHTTLQTQPASVHTTKQQQLPYIYRYLAFHIFGQTDTVDFRVDRKGRFDI